MQVYIPGRVTLFERNGSTNARSMTSVHVHEFIRVKSSKDHIDPNLWRPLIMNLQRFQGLGNELHPSCLAQTDEEWYR